MGNSLVEAFIKETRFRRFMEGSGLYLGFILALTVLWVGWDAIKQGHPASGAAVITGVIVGLVSAFIYGSKHRPSGAVVEDHEPPERVGKKHRKSR